MNKEEIKKRWNDLADGYNQWESLGMDEKYMLFMGATDVTDEDLINIREVNDAK